MKNFKFLFLLFIICTGFVNAEEKTTSIPLRLRGGVYQVPATLNSELKVFFVVDSGASDVTISEDVAKILVKNESLDKKDIIGNGNYQIANGDTTVGTVINIKTIEIAGYMLNNIKAVVMKGDNVPLLLGQSALRKLGSWSINTKKNTLDITSSEKPIPFVPPKDSSSTAGTIPNPPNSDSNLRRVRSDDESIDYVILNTIKKQGIKGSLWQIIDFKSDESPRELSRKVRWEFDCTNERMRNSDSTSYTKHMGKGTVVQSLAFPEKEWDAVIPGTYGEELWEGVCKGKEIAEDTKGKLTDQLMYELECDHQGLLLEVFTYKNSLVNVDNNDTVDIPNPNEYIEKCRGRISQIRLKSLYHDYSKRYYINQEYANSESYARKCLSIDELNIDCLEYRIKSTFKLYGANSVSHRIEEYNRLIKKMIKDKLQDASKTKVKSEEVTYKLNDDIAYLRTKVARLYFELDDFENAKTSSEICLTNDPNNISCYDLKIKILLRETKDIDRDVVFAKFREILNRIIIHHKSTLAKTRNAEDIKFLKSKIEEETKILVELDEGIKSGKLPDLN